MIVLLYMLLFSKLYCLLVLCYIYLHVQRGSTRRVQVKWQQKVVFQMKQIKIMEPVSHNCQVVRVCTSKSCARKWTNVLANF